MKKLFILSSFILANYSLPSFAGTPQTNLDCRSQSTHMVIKGYPRGEGYDLQIKMDGSSLRYIDACNDVHCSKRIKQGDLYVVEALNKKVFTIYFAEPSNIGEIFMGYFYAIPETVKYMKTTHGYRAEYKALYDGADPRSDTYPKQFMKKAIELTCTHQEEL